MRGSRPRHLHRLPPLQHPRGGRGRQTLQGEGACEEALGLHEPRRLRGGGEEGLRRADRGSRRQGLRRHVHGRCPPQGDGVEGGRPKQLQGGAVQRQHGAEDEDGHRGGAREGGVEVILKGRKVVGGTVEGEALVSSDPVSFYGGVDPDTGVITEPGHVLCGKCITGKVFVFPTGKGSTVGSYVIYRMKKQGTAPAAIINVETEAILATGCVISSIPLVDKLDKNPLKTLKTGMKLRIVGEKGLVESI
ncbi:TPA: DUF126 domain-containing protein [Candidatus Bathyarchaeota archaeon]|nr:DUF126 domain-containing protein [Candidatus Bathyarchaeota archaeon]